MKRLVFIKQEIFKPFADKSWELVKQGENLKIATSKVFSYKAYDEIEDKVLTVFPELKKYPTILQKIVVDMCNDFLSIKHYSTLFWYLQKDFKVIAKAHKNHKGLDSIIREHTESKNTADFLEYRFKTHVVDALSVIEKVSRELFIEFDVYVFENEKDFEEGNLEKAVKLNIKEFRELPFKIYFKFSQEDLKKRPFIIDLLQAYGFGYDETEKAFYSNIRDAIEYFERNLLDCRKPFKYTKYTK